MESNEILNNAAAETASLKDIKVELKRYFGFDSFRPLQEEIISDVLAGRDVFALLPTGGGKSLCYQLPALVLEGLTVVVSPLIALMKDQVDGLTEIGAPATYLNSAVDGDESRVRLKGLYRGEFKLLYVSPERLLMDGFIAELKKWNVTRIAIDEAHCISEWGHDFRPEYRQLACLRDLFPGVPLLALTATATERVRRDISAQLRLEKARNYVASFNRPNLIYRVVPKTSPHTQVKDFLQDHPGESGIIYCQSRQATEDLATYLCQHDIRALPYHAGLERATRDKHQELFSQDEVPIIVATIAFGMGVDKPNVRFVVHQDLPKNIESYYQETGRAGRDGLPAECLLLFSPADVAKIYQFIEQKESEQERIIARSQLSQMVAFSEGSACRRSALLGYFSEVYSTSADSKNGCASCDNCLTPREKFDGTVFAQKLLSCVWRIKEKSGFAVGMQHVIDVLLGSRVEKVLRFGHDKLSTYGIGADTSRAAWLVYARELVQLGLLRQNVERFNVLEITNAGLVALKERQVINLTKPLITARLAKDKRTLARKQAGAIDYDEKLFERLRNVRMGLARQRNLPAYMIFSDVTLQHISAVKPKTESALLGITGVGEKKLKQFGKIFIDEVKGYAIKDK